MSLTVIPFWRFLHASPILRIPIGIVNLLGAWIFLVGIVSGEFRFHTLSEDLALCLISVNMFSLSAAFFTFKNELA